MIFLASVVAGCCVVVPGNQARNRARLVNGKALLCPFTSVNLIGTGHFIQHRIMIGLIISFSIGSQSC